jgi:hypothetical protein
MRVKTKQMFLCFLYGWVIETWMTLLIGNGALKFYDQRLDIRTPYNGKMPNLNVGFKDGIKVP